MLEQRAALQDLVLSITNALSVSEIYSTCTCLLTIPYGSIATVMSTRLVLRHKWALHSRVGLCHFTLQGRFVSSQIVAMKIAKKNQTDELTINQAL